MAPGKIIDIEQAATAYEWASEEWNAARAALIRKPQPKATRPAGTIAASM
jgi:hypothetical protein